MNKYNTLGMVYPAMTSSSSDEILSHTHGINSSRNPLSHENKLVDADEPQGLNQEDMIRHMEESPGKHRVNCAEVVNKLLDVEMIDTRDKSLSKDCMLPLYGCIFCSHSSTSFSKLAFNIQKTPWNNLARKACLPRDCNMHPATLMRVAKFSVMSLIYLGLISMILLIIQWSIVSALLIQFLIF
ncbi:hypothetical protein [Chromobacterium haemolyticum]|uniref:hypothetical protein n=1 Tax=Chromobacterium haemolyticum TaxID=394935 RepID=UPI001746BCF6|nr:hypothetical protein [Chromobacterium haemolyticum]QOD81163.1 hypothetical protein IEZ30_14600 [Chromobacterium haemolyticum]